MDILSTVSLESNSKIKINFDGGDLSSDSGLLLLKEFCCKIGAVKLVRRLFHTNDSAWYRIHKDDDNLLQVIYQIFAAYFEDDCADELTNEPVMGAVLEKESLASQPTLSRFFHRMDETTLEQFNQILRELRKVIYSIKMPEFILFDIDTTLLDAFGAQEGAAFNYHYQDKGYHPLFAFDGLTGDLLKAQLRDGTQYCSKEADAFMRSLLEEFKEDFPDIPLYLRGDSGFASPALYEVLEEKGCKYAIRLKENKTLIRLADEGNRALYRATKYNQVDPAVVYGEFLYQAGSWSHPRRVVNQLPRCKHSSTVLGLLRRPLTALAFCSCFARPKAGYAGITVSPSTYNQICLSLPLALCSEIASYTHSPDFLHNLLSLLHSHVRSLSTHNSPLSRNFLPIIVSSLPGSVQTLLWPLYFLLSLLFVSDYSLALTV